MLEELSVAEVVRRPFYRVTRVDVGKNAEDVEQVSSLFAGLW